MNEIAKTLAAYDKHAEYYKEISAIAPNIQERLDDFLSKLDGRKVLDAGCAFGLHAKYMADQGYSVTGIDLCPSLLLMAEEYAPNVRFEPMDIRKVYFGEETFDGVWASASLLHVPKEQSQSTMRGFYDVLEKNGILFCSVKSGVGEGLQEWKDGSERFFSFYTPSELETLADSCGFADVDVISNQDDTRDITWLSLYARK